MRRIRIVVFSQILTLAFISQALATRYFVRVDGNDANDGASWASAWATIDKVNNTISIGDTVLFGTGTWYDSQIQPPIGGSSWTVYACSSFVEANPTGGKQLAKIWGGVTVTGWTDTTINGNTAYKASWTGSGCITSGKCYTLGQGDSLLVPQSQLSYLDQAGEFFHNNTDNILYARCYGGGDPDNYTMIASCKPPVLMRNNDYNYIKVWGLDLQYGKEAIVYLSPYCDSVFIEHCHLAKVGQQRAENPACVFSDSDVPSGHYNTVLACSLGWVMDEDNTADNSRGAPPTSGFGHGGAVVTYSQENFYVDSCYIYGFCNIGVLYKNDTAGGAPFTGNVARFNTITAQNEGIYFYNYPDRDSAYGNIIYNVSEGIKMEGGGGNDPSLYVGKIFIANNTIYNVEKAFFALPGSYAADADTCGSYNEVLYNVAVKHNWTDGESYFTGFLYGNVFCDETFTMDSNYYYDASQSFLGYEPYSTGRTWEEWQNSVGFDLHGYNQDPGLADPENGDFSRRNASNEMNRTYGGRTWTIFGAWQPGDSTDTDVTDGDSTDEQSATLNIHPFPNPFRTSAGHTYITFTNLPVDSKIIISTVSGKIVQNAKGVGPDDWVWEVKNEKGKDLSSGVYLYKVEFKDGSSHGKLVVIR